MSKANRLLGLLEANIQLRSASSRDLMGYDGVEEPAQIAEITVIGIPTIRGVAGVPALPADAVVGADGRVDVVIASEEGEPLNLSKKYSSQEDAVDAMGQLPDRVSWNKLTALGFKLL